MAKLKAAAALAAEAPPAQAAPGKTHFRVAVRHCPLDRPLKRTVVEAADPNEAWQAFLAKIEKQLNTEGDPGKKRWDAFSLWLETQSSPPVEAEILPEAVVVERLEKLRVKAAPNGDRG